MSDVGKLYQEAILEHHARPRHAAAVASPTHRAALNNPLCGDRVTLTLRVAAGRVEEVGCEVKGCAICRASGSLLAERIVGGGLEAAASASRRFLREIAPGAAEAVDFAAWGPVAALFEARRFPSRLRCATLPWEALQRALSSDGGMAAG